MQMKAVREEILPSHAAVSRFSSLRTTSKTESRAEATIVMEIEVIYEFSSSQPRRTAIRHDYCASFGC
ncbi:hypothetical protein Mapa_002694 [Marchantia paleacea]|nr:hypothetical protein Mapa_002694 [Marchantia paleacea]